MTATLEVNDNCLKLNIDSNCRMKEAVYCRDSLFYKIHKCLEIILSGITKFNQFFSLFFINYDSIIFKEAESSHLI